MDRSARETSVEPDDESQPPEDEAATMSVPEPTSYAVSRFNASKHGILSKETVLPWEDRAEYERLFSSLIEEHLPTSPTEEHLVEELAGIIWRKRRLRSAESAAVRRGLSECIGGPRVYGNVVREHTGTAEAALAEVAYDRRVAAKMPLAAQAVQQSDEEAQAELEHIPLAMQATEQALTILTTKGASKYKRAVAALDPATAEMWDDELTRSAMEMEKQENDILRSLGATPSRRAVTYEATNYDLAEWLEVEAIPHYKTRQVALERREALRSQAFAEAVKPHYLEKLARYETHLDRKFEKTLAVLLKLQELRRAREGGWS